MSRLYHYCQQYEIDSKPTAEPFDGDMSNQPPSKSYSRRVVQKHTKNPIDAAVDRADLFVCSFDFSSGEKKMRRKSIARIHKCDPIESVEMV